MIQEKFFIEPDRLSVFIGSEGANKKILEEKFACSIEINSNTGEVFVESEDALNVFILSNIVNAINYGHSPEHALQLEDENIVLDIIDVKPKVRSHTRLKSVMGRIIGKNGSTRRVLEEITGCNVSVRDTFVSVIGPFENVDLVREALDMFIKGASHKALYQYLERNKTTSSKGLL